MNIDANGERDEDEAIRDGNLSESKISYQAGDLKVSGSTIEGDKGAADRQQRPQNTVEHWDRFLHLRSIRVLLVENDGSTRHIVTALLRNCNYEVIEAANGLQAWKILEDLTNHIDVVLTEVVMPCVSGIALLRKIKSHKTRKIIPVIMMSSHDSMGLVFNCLSKGAIDFLVKPIRKNELKNLWQHVWRRCHSSSGSGSESGTQTQKSVKSKVSQKADNIGSDDGQNNGSNGLNVGDGSDDGNGAQSSWTKQAVEVESSRSLSPIDQVADCPDSTCAQVIHPNAENSGNRGLDTVVPREAHEQKQPDTVAKGKDLEKTISKNMESKSEIPLTLTGANLKSSSDVDCHMSIKQVDKGQLNLTGECLYNKQKDASAVISAPLVDVKESESTREVASILEINNNATDEYKDPNFELSLKRLRGFQGTGASDQDDRLVSRRFEQSAFSRYNASSNIFNAPNGIAQSSSIIGNSVERESATDIQAHSTEHLVYQSSNEVSNNIDMGSTTNNLRARSSIMKVNSETTSTVNGLHRSSFKHVKNVANGPMDGDLMNYNLNRSASGSNHGSSTAINTLGTNTKSNFEQTSGSGSGDASGSGSGTGVDENKRAQREAALIKFRQKKKDRSFMKKVRYQTRKSLAEQRPRVRGQFVKQIRTDSSSRSEDG